MKRQADTPCTWHLDTQASRTACRLCLYPLPDRMPIKSITLSLGELIWLAVALMFAIALPTTPLTASKDPVVFCLRVDLPHLSRLQTDVQLTLGQAFSVTVVDTINSCCCMMRVWACGAVTLSLSSHKLSAPERTSRKTQAKVLLPPSFFLSELQRLLGETGPTLSNMLHSAYHSLLRGQPHNRNVLAPRLSYARQMSYFHTELLRARKSRSSIDICRIAG